MKVLLEKIKNYFQNPKNLIPNILVMSFAILVVLFLPIKALLRWFILVVLAFGIALNYLAVKKYIYNMFNNKKKDTIIVDSNEFKKYDKNCNTKDVSVEIIEGDDKSNIEIEIDD